MYRMERDRIGKAQRTGAFSEQAYAIIQPLATGTRTWPPFQDYIVGARVQVRLTD
jgi:hypothetical protein